MDVLGRLSFRLILTLANFQICNLFRPVFRYIYLDPFRMILTHLYSLILTRTHSYSLVLTRTHSYSLILTHTNSCQYLDFYILWDTFGMFLGQFRQTQTPLYSLYSSLDTHIHSYSLVLTHTPILRFHFYVGLLWDALGRLGPYRFMLTHTHLYLFILTCTHSYSLLPMLIFCINFGLFWQVFMSNQTF